MNTLGQLFKITSFGESHGPVVGAVVEGCPSLVELDADFIQSELKRRRPGQSKVTSAREEADTFEILSGVFDGKTTGAPICIQIINTDARPSDYEPLSDVYRPSHADYTYQMKYGIRDYRGGGRSSARITAAWVAAGAIAKTILTKQGIIITAFVSQIYAIKLGQNYQNLDLNKVEESLVRCPDLEISKQMEAAIALAKTEGDSLGGIICCVIKGAPVGLGDPVFGKLHSKLAQAITSINAVKGIQFGDGFNSVNLKGSEINDAFRSKEGKINTLSNHSGGIQGGISNGEDIYFDTVFKPTSTIGKAQKTVNSKNENVDITAGGRHDPCVVPRAVPIVEALAACVLLDCLLLQKANTL